MSYPHEQVPVLVWVDIDEGIVDFVLFLNTLPGIRTHTSCQGTIGEGGPNPYPPQVMVTWENDAALGLLTGFKMTPLGKCFAYVHPPEGWKPEIDRLRAELARYEEKPLHCPCCDGDHL